jgi:hypothetical protein
MWLRKAFSPSNRQGNNFSHVLLFQAEWYSLFMNQLTGSIDVGLRGDPESCSMGKPNTQTRP